MTQVVWRGEQALEGAIGGGVRQRHFDVLRDDADRGEVVVPAVLWTPADYEARDGPLPLVLIGHGGAGHKSDESRVDLGLRYAGDHGIAAAAIDGPAHGDRRLPPGGTVPGYGPEVVASMVLDWRATLDALAALPEIDAGRVGYGGVSMGTMFGLPFVAEEPRVRAAVLGLNGLTREDGERYDLSELLEASARRVRCPTLFLMQWDDELFPRDGVLELFGMLASEEKRLLAHPGPHHGAPEEVRDITTAFLVDRLRAL